MSSASKVRDSMARVEWRMKKLQLVARGVHVENALAQTGQG